MLSSDSNNCYKSKYNLLIINMYSVSGLKKVFMTIIDRRLPYYLLYRDRQKHDR